MGHTSEEKIKILYEDSLADIRALTDKIESAAVKVAEVANSVGEKKALLTRSEKSLTEQIEKIKSAVDKTKTNSTTASSTSLQTVVIAVMAFGAGFGSQQLSVLAVVSVGIIVGILTCQSAFLFYKDSGLRQKLENPVKTHDLWTEAVFKRAAEGIKLSTRTLAGCREILVEDASVGGAATRYQVLPKQILDGLRELRESELKTRN